MELAEWEAFYLITGPSGAVLTGLMFVVVALAADRIPRRSKPGPSPEMNAFATPNIVHFAVVLLVASLMMIPGETVLTLRGGLALCALYGLVYSVVTVMRMRRLEDYAPVLDDWIWHATLPVGAYAALLAGSYLLGAEPETALYTVAGGVLLLLVIGLHNAWDIALFTATYRASPEPKASDAAVQMPADSGPPPVT